MFTWWIEKNFGLNIVCLRAKTKTQLSPGGHDGWLSVNDINLSADIHTFHVAPYQRGTKMQEIELCIDSEIEEILKASTEQKEKEKEKEGVYKLNKPKNKLKNIHSKTLVGTDGTQETILIKDVKKEDEVRELKEKNSALLREKGKRGRNKRDSRLRLQRDKELEGTFQILLEESQKEILNLESERDSHKTAADKYRAEREKVKLAVEEQKIIQETLKSEYEQKAADALYQITTLTNTLKQSEEQNHKLLEENNKLKRELTRNKYPNIKSDNNNSTEGNIVNSGVISTYPPILSQGSQNEHSPSYHKISSLITSVQDLEMERLTLAKDASTVETAKMSSCSEFEFLNRSLIDLEEGYLQQKYSIQDYTC